MACAAQAGTAITVALVDDHPIFRAGLRMLLESQPGIRVIVEGASGAEAAAVVAERRPDIVLLDRLEDLRLIRDAQYETRPIILAASVTRQQVLEALHLGAMGVLLKSSTTDVLLRCIRTVLSGEYWVNRQAAADLVGALRLQGRSVSPGEDRQHRLTSAERRVIASLRTGASNKRIARELGVTEQTVKNRLSHLYARFSAANRLDLVLKLTRMGLLAD